MPVSAWYMNFPESRVASNEKPKKASTAQSARFISLRSPKGLNCRPPSKYTTPMQTIRSRDTVTKVTSLVSSILK